MFKQINVKYNCKRLARNFRTKEFKETLTGVQIYQITNILLIL